MDLKDLLAKHFIDIETVFDSILDGVVIATNDEKFLYWNQAAKDMLADSPDESDPKEWATRYQIYRVDDGSLVRYEDLPMVRALSGEALVSGITTFRNVSDLVRKEEEANDERRFYQRILDLMPGIVFIKDLQGKFLYGNQEFHEILKTRSVIGNGTKDYLLEAEASEILQHDQEVLRTGMSHVYQESIRWSDGRKNVYETVRFPYRVEGKIIGICAVSRDISSEVESQNHLEEIRNRSQQLSKLAAVGTLSAEIAHEIRNPLTILKTSIDVIKVVVQDEVIDTEIIKNKIQVINETILRMSKVTSSLGIISKDSSMEQFSNVKASEILEDVVSLCSFKTKKMKMNIELDMDECRETLVYVNQVQISEVVLNLVTNALDAVEKKPNPVIRITCSDKSGFIIIKVYDNGSGVSEDIREKIFEPFFTTKNALKGNGLGLSISSKIVKQHDGELFYSEEGYEHAFVLKLPLSKMATPS